VKTKKILLSLGLTLAMAVSVCAAKDNIWQYNQNIAINMSSAKVTTENGMTVLTFETTETFGESTDQCTYVYNVDDQTIQLKELVSKVGKKKFKQNFYPQSIADGNDVIKGRAHMAELVLQRVRH
jgi:hypothetical protein